MKAKTTRDLASIRLAHNLKKIVRVAAMSYKRQTAFYKKCTSPDTHVRRMVQHFFIGFYLEVKAEQMRAAVLTNATTPIQELDNLPTLALQF